MAIEFSCIQCGRKLRMADEHAGRAVRCPQCGATNKTPAASVVVEMAIAQTGAGASEAEEMPDTKGSMIEPADFAAELVAPGMALADVLPQPTAAPIPQNTPTPPLASGRWMLRAGDEVYGPVSKTELDRWVSEQRVDRTCEVRAEGQQTWQNAAEIYPQLASDLIAGEGANSWQSVLSTTMGPRWSQPSGAMVETTAAKPSSKAPAREPSVFDGLIDFRLLVFAAPRLARMLYALLLVLSVATVIGTWTAAGLGIHYGRISQVLGWTAIAAAPIVALLLLLTARIGCELMVVTFRMAEYMRDLRTLAQRQEKLGNSRY